MKISSLIISGIFLVASPLFARDKVDVLVMNNGDRLTCEIKGLDSGVLYVGFDYIQGTVEVNWLKVHHVESKQLFLVKTQDGRNYVGTLSMVETDEARPLRIDVVEAPEKNVLVQQRDVVGIDQTSENFWRRFNGAINSGLSYSKANETRQYTISANAQYLRQRWSSGASITSTLAGSTGVTTSTRNNVGAYYRHLMRRDNWFYNGIGSFLQSSEQEIQAQNTFGMGIGRYLKNTNRSMINIFGGLAYQNTNYTETEAQQGSQNTAAAVMGAEAGLFKFDKTRVNVSAVALPALNQPGRVYSNANASYYFKFFGKLTWNFSFYGNWDNQPPANFSGSDYGLSSGFGLTFGNSNSYNK